MVTPCSSTHTQEQALRDEMRYEGVRVERRTGVDLLVARYERASVTIDEDQHMDRQVRVPTMLEPLH
jgi:hypothetical protein